MSTYPRTDAFTALTGSLPANGAAYIPGWHEASDPGADAIGTPNRYGTRDAGVKWADANTDAVAWWAYRETAASADVLVDGMFFWRHVSGSQRDVSVGLMARATAYASTGSGYWYGLTGYILTAAIDVSAGTADLTVSRVNAGTVTQLGTYSGLPWAENQNIRLGLQVRKVVSAVAWVEVFADGQRLILGVDTSPIATAGHYGLLTSDAKTTTSETRASCRQFRAQAWRASTYWLDDDWDRPNRSAAAASYYTTSLWTPATLMETASGQVSYSSEDATHRVALWQARPYAVGYYVEASVTLASALYENWGGVVARASVSGSAGDWVGFTGYVALFGTHTATDNLQVRKYVGGTLVASATASLSVTAASAHTIRLTVSGTDTVTAVLKLDGTDRVTLTDTAESRLTQAGQAGLYGYRHASAGAIVFDGFTLSDGAAPSTSITQLNVSDERTVGSTNYVQGEDLSASCNGVTTTFALANTPASTSEVAVFLGGVRLLYDATPSAAWEYSVSTGGPSVTLGAAPPGGSTLVVDYVLDGNDDVVVGEEPFGAKNGSNKIFSLAEWPKDDIRLFQAGMRLTPTTGSPGVGQYRRSSKTLLLGTAPTSGQALYADYVKRTAATAQPIISEVPAGTKNGGNRIFTLAKTPATPAQCALFHGGTRLRLAGSSPGSGEFVLVGRTITLGVAPESGDSLLADYVRADIATGLFEYVPDYVVPVSRDMPHVAWRSEYGYEQGFPITTTMRRTVQASFLARTKTERDSILAFFAARGGSYQEFTWTCPKDSTASLWHLSGPLRDIKQAPDVYDIHATLEELVVFNPAAEAA